MADKEKELYCAHCRALLTQEDDVVWCPDCGAPHHRACWRELGHCALQERHGLPEPEEPEIVEPEIVDEPAEDAPVEDGAPVGGVPPFYAPFAPGASPAFNPYGGVDPEGEMKGQPVAEVAAFVRVNTRRYLPRFRRMCDTGGKVSWNVGGFLFGGVWLLYRKCFIEGVAALIATLIAMLAQAPLYQYLNQYITDHPELLEQTSPLGTGSLGMESLMRAVSAVETWPVLLFLAGWALSVAVHLVIGLFGDRIYMGRCLDKVAAIRADDEIENKLQALVVAGGVHPLLAATAFVALYYLSGFLPFIL